MLGPAAAGAGPVLVAGRAFPCLGWILGLACLSLLRGCNLHANALPCREPSFIKPRPLQARPALPEKAVEP
jgi:hypothetical protein